MLNKVYSLLKKMFADDDRFRTIMSENQSVVFLYFIVPGESPACILYVEYIDHPVIWSIGLQDECHWRDISESVFLNEIINTELNATYALACDHYREYGRIKYDDRDI